MANVRTAFLRDIALFTQARCCTAWNRFDLVSASWLWAGLKAESDRSINASCSLNSIQRAAPSFSEAAKTRFLIW